jgi:AraC-like DNA-binding protein
MSDLRSVLPDEELHRRLSHHAKLIQRSSINDCPRASVRRGSSESLPGQTIPGSASQSIGLPSARLKRILAHIDAHLDKNITLADLAADARLSVYYFATQFKRSTGFSPHRYILYRRVTRARELLRNTRLSVLDVSLDLGFQHQNNFARAFRRVTGMTPSHFRHSIASEKQNGKMKRGRQGLLTEHCKAI